MRTYHVMQDERLHALVNDHGYDTVREAVLDYAVSRGLVRFADALVEREAVGETERLGRLLSGAEAELSASSCENETLARRAERAEHEAASLRKLVVELQGGVAS